MNAISRFNQTISRCHSLLEEYKSSCKNVDLPRFAIVLAVAALERYVKDSFMVHLVDELKKENVDSDLRQLVTEAGVTSDFWEQCVRKHTERPYRKASNAVKRHLLSFSIQNKKSISDLFKCYSLGSIVDHAQKKADRKTLWKSTEKAIKRRHQIVHAGDFGNMGRLQAVDFDETNHRIEDIKLLVANMEDIIRNKFSKTKRRATASKSTKPAK